MKLVAKVPTNDGTFNNTVISPLISPTPMATNERGHDGPPDGNPVGPQPVHDPGGEQEHLAGGKVDLAEHQHENLTDGDRPDRPGEPGGGVQAERTDESSTT